MLISRGLDHSTALISHPAPQDAPHPLRPSRLVLHSVDFEQYHKCRHPRAHSTVEPPHPMPNWVVKHSSANDTRTAGSRKSRSARGFFCCGSSSAGRALPCQGRCREFESRLPLHTPFASPEVEGLFCCQVNKNKNAGDRNYPLSPAFLLDFSVLAEQSGSSWSVT